MTVVVGPSASPFNSIRMPPTLRWRWMRSFGHLSATSLKPSASSARTTATPTASDSPARKPAPCSNFQPSENVRLPPAIAVHARPRRPRPAVCHSAASATRWTSRRCARRMSSEDVDSIWSTTSIAIGSGMPRASRQLGEARPDLLGVEEIGRLEQAVAAALDPLEREARRAGVLQDLRNAGARQPHLGGEVLAGMELSIGKLAQQRESERSEHLLTDSREQPRNVTRRGLPSGGKPMRVDAPGMRPTPGTCRRLRARRVSRTRRAAPAPRRAARGRRRRRPSRLRRSARRPTSVIVPPAASTIGISACTS